MESLTPSLYFSPPTYSKICIEHTRRTGKLLGSGVCDSWPVADPSQKQEEKSYDKSLVRRKADNKVDIDARPRVRMI